MSKLPRWYGVSLLVCTAAYFIATPRAGEGVVFTAIIMAGATNSADTLANVVAYAADDMGVNANGVAGPPFVVGFVADDPNVKARSPDVLGVITDNFVVFSANFIAIDTVCVGVLANIAAGIPDGVRVVADTPNVFPWPPNLRETSADSPKLPLWYEVDILAGTADIVVAAPEAVAAFAAFAAFAAAICETARALCANAKATALAGPVFLGTVVGFASSDTPGSSDSFFPVSSGSVSVVVETVAFGSESVGGSTVRPVVFRPPRIGAGGDLVASVRGRGGMDLRFSNSFAFFLGCLICPEVSELSSASS